MRTEPSPQMSCLELALMDALLAGDHPILEQLLAQYRASRPTTRELSGTGFFLNFEVPADVPRLAARNFELGDASFQLDGLEGGGAAILFVRNGAVAWLEGYSFGGSWPETEGDFTIQHFEGARDLDALVTSVLARQGPAA